MKIAVIENEFGEVGIDDKLVLKKFETEEEIFEMNNGCICCTVRGDLIRVLNKILKKKKRLDCIIIETTGMADPAPVAQTFYMDEDIMEHSFIDSIIGVVDSKHILEHLDSKSEKEGSVVNECTQQIAFADKILMNKVDLVDETEQAQVRQRIKAINRFAEVIPTTKAEVPLDKILGLKSFDLERLVESEGFEVEFQEDLSACDAGCSNPDHDHGHGHGHGHGEDHHHEHGEDHHHAKSAHSNAIESFAIVKPGALDLAMLNQWMAALIQKQGSDIYRMKGVLCLDGMDEKFVFQGVHMQLDTSSLGSWGTDEPRINRLVFIGRDLNKEEMTADFHRCLVEE